jgi:hypothetical protein
MLSQFRRVASPTSHEGSSSQQTTGDEPRFYYVNAVWGEDYVDVFCAISIPTLLSPANLPSLPNRAVSQFLILTTPEDRKRIAASAIYPLLAATIEVVFLPIKTAAAHKYELMNRAHKRAIEYVARRGFCVFLAPDAVVSDGMLRRLYDLARAGRRVVAGFGPRLVQETIVPEFTALPGYRVGEGLTLPPRELVSIALRHLHPDTLQHDVASESFPEQPYACFWKGPNGDGMLLRSLNLHPYLFDCGLVPPGENLDNVTIDWALMPRFVLDWNTFYVETDSDNFSIYGLSPLTVRAKPRRRNKIDAEVLSVWLLRNNYAFINRASFAYAIKFHVRPLNEDWAKLEKATREFALNVIDPNRSLREQTLLGYSFRPSNKVNEPRFDTIEHHPSRAGEAPLPVTSGGGNATVMHPGLAAEDTAPTLLPRASAVPVEQVPFYFAFTIWGRKYVDYLMRYGVPSLLAPNNIPALPNRAASSFIIVTTPEDEELIRAASIFDMLAQVIRVEFVRLPPVPLRMNKYQVLALGHGIVADMALGRGFAVFLGPDGIYPDGMMMRLYEHAQAGKQVVVGLGPRVNEETIVAELTETGALKAGEPLTVAPRQAASLLLRHLHEDARLLRWVSPMFPRTPYMCIWDMPGGQGMLVRSFSLHPYLVDYRDALGPRVRPQESAVDASFVIDCLFPWDKIHQVTDSDEFMVLSVTPMADMDFPREPNRNPSGTLAIWARSHDKTMLHRAYFMKALKIHIDDLDHHWLQLEQDTLKLSCDILNSSAGGSAPESTDYRQLFAEHFNEMLAGDVTGVSGRLALQVVWRKLLRKLRG